LPEDRLFIEALSEGVEAANEEERSSSMLACDTTRLDNKR
jgi:hypothetical protein